MKRSLEWVGLTTALMKEYPGARVGVAPGLFVVVGGSVVTGGLLKRLDRFNPPTIKSHLPGFEVVVGVGVADPGRH